METGTRYSDEFKQEAVNQVIVHDYDASAVPHGGITSGLSLLMLKGEWTLFRYSAGVFYCLSFHITSSLINKLGQFT